MVLRVGHDAVHGGRCEIRVRLICRGLRHVRCQVGGCGGLRRKSLRYNGLSDCCASAVAVRAPGHSPTPRESHKILGLSTAFARLLSLQKEFHRGELDPSQCNRRIGWSRFGLGVSYQIPGTRFGVFSEGTGWVYDFDRAGLNNTSSTLAGLADSRTGCSKPRRHGIRVRWT